MASSKKSANEALLPLIKLGMGDAEGDYVRMAEAFRSVLDYTLEAIVILNIRGDILYLNKAAELSNENIQIGANYFNSEGDISLPVIKEAINSVFKTANPSVYQLDVISNDEPKVVSCTVNPLKKEGKVYAVTIISRDVTDEEQTKLLAQESQERLELALSGGEIGIWELDLKTQKVICDPLVLDIYGLENFDGSLGGFNKGIHEEDKYIFENAIKESVLTREPFEIEYRLLVEGETVFVLNKAKVLLGSKNDPKKIIGVCQDITHLRKEELGALNAIISAQEKERERLGKEIHDGIGQLLSAVRMNLNALSLELGKQNNELNTQIDNIKNLISEAVDEARSVSHALVPGRVQELGLRRSLENLCETYNIRDLKIEFESNHDANSRYDTIIELNYYRMAQELISNAVKHSQASEIYVHLENNDGRLELEVRDDGIGLDNRYMKKKSGIGLNNVVSRVNYLNGNITIDSIPGRGTSIRIECVPELIEKAML